MKKLSQAQRDQAIIVPIVHSLSLDRYHWSQALLCFVLLHLRFGVLKLLSDRILRSVLTKPLQDYVTGLVLFWKLFFKKDPQSSVHYRSNIDSDLMWFCHVILILKCMHDLCCGMITNSSYVNTLIIAINKTKIIMSINDPIQ